MPRRAGFLFTLVSALSLLACAASVGLGLYSYRVGRLVEWKSLWFEAPLSIVERRQVLGMSGGTFVYSVRTDRTDHTDPLLASDAVDDWHDRTPKRLNFVVFQPQPLTLSGYRVVDLKVFRYATLGRGPRSFERAVLVPFWVIALASAVLPAWWAARYRRRALTRRRLAAGQCLRCGYDRRAQQPGDPCPECGATPDVRDQRSEVSGQ
jgi:hypothetical protein